MFTLSKSSRSCCYIVCLHFPWVRLRGVKRNLFRIPLTDPVYTGNNAKSGRYKLRLRVLSNFDERQTSQKNSQCEIRRIREARGAPKSHFRNTAYVTRLRGPHDARVSPAARMSPAASYFSPKLETPLTLLQANEYFICVLLSWWCNCFSLESNYEFNYALESLVKTRPDLTPTRSGIHQVPQSREIGQFRIVLTCVDTKPPWGSLWLANHVTIGPAYFNRPRAICASNA